MIKQQTLYYGIYEASGVLKVFPCAIESQTEKFIHLLPNQSQLTQVNKRFLNLNIDDNPGGFKMFSNNRSALLKEFEGFKAVEIKKHVNTIETLTNSNVIDLF